VSEVLVDKRKPGIMQFASLGLLNAVCLGAGLAGGWFVDQALGTLPLFLFLGMVAGIALGVYATRSEWKRYS
jgi:F0F1-type ATP synthase assembly protein I